MTAITPNPEEAVMPTHPCTNCMGSGWDPNGCVINGPDCDLDDHLIEHTHCCPICDGTGKRVPDLMDALRKSFADAKAARDRHRSEDGNGRGSDDA